MDATSPPPVGELIEAAREHMGLSQNAAAEKAGISGTHWRTIVSGGVSMTSQRGAKTLARMAEVVGVTPDELEAAGRADVAERLRIMLPPDDLDEPLSDAEIDQIAAEADEILTRLEKRIASDRNRAQVEAARRLVSWVVEEETNRADRP